MKPIDVLNWLYGLQKKFKIDLGRAESRPGVQQCELDALNRKLEYVDYLIERTIREL